MKSTSYKTFELPLVQRPYLTEDRNSSNHWFVDKFETTFERRLRSVKFSRRTTHWYIYKQIISVVTEVSVSGQRSNRPLVFKAANELSNLLVC